MKLLILGIASCYCLSGAVASAQTATDVTCTSCVGETDIANQAVTGAKIANGSVTGADIRPERHHLGPDQEPDDRHVRPGAVVAGFAGKRDRKPDRREGQRFWQPAWRAQPARPAAFRLRPAASATTRTAAAISACCLAARLRERGRQRVASTKRGASIPRFPFRSPSSAPSASAPRRWTVRRGFRRVQDSQSIPERHPSPRRPSRRNG